MGAGHGCGCSSVILEGLRLFSVCLIRFAKIACKRFERQRIETFGDLSIKVAVDITYAKSKACLTNEFTLEFCEFATSKFEK